MGTAGGNAQNPFFWNTLQGNKSSTGAMSVGMDPSGNTTSALAAMAGMGMGSSSNHLGMMDSNSMQALLQQQGGSMSMGNNQHQMLGMGQGQLNGKDLSGMGNMNSGTMMVGQSAQQLQMLQKMGGSSSSHLGGNSGRSDGVNQGQLQTSSAGNTNAQLLLQQQSMIADLKRQLQAQQGGGADRRTSAMMSTQQQLLQQIQQRSSVNPAMLQQITPGMMNDSSSRSHLHQRQSSNSSLGGGATARQGSLGHSEPISIAQLMGHQSSQQGSLNTITQLGGQPGISITGSGGSNQRNNAQLQTNSNSLLGGGMFDGNSGPSSQQNMLIQQQLQQMAKSNMDAFPAMGSNSRSGSINDHFLAQQQQILNASGMSQADIQKAQHLLMNQSMAMGQPIQSLNQSMGQSVSRPNSSLNPLGMSQPLTNAADPLMDGLKGAPDVNTGPGHGIDNGDKSSACLDDLDSSGRVTSNSKVQMGNQLIRNIGNKKKDDAGPNSQSFLDGTFAGGWQSNADLPDRRDIILSICKVIEQMRPDANRMSQKLPFMAKRLEEHLYRSAQTKEEYLDLSTLKKRLQLIAHGLESHRSASGGSTEDGTSNSPVPSQGSGFTSSTGGGTSEASNLQQQMQQLQQLQQLQHFQQNYEGSNKNLMDNLNPMMLKPSGLTHDDMYREQAKQLSIQQANLHGPPGYQSGFGQVGSQTSAAQIHDSLSAQQSQFSARQPIISSLLSGESTGILKNVSKYQDPQKTRVIKQQQQRLLLLRHASKCEDGADCKVKFCSQMVELWEHMKKCRDKNCKTAHCLSSRCVLNHYRICKSENKTSSCEVCGPVKRQIKQQSSERNDDLEPLQTSKDDGSLSTDSIPPDTGSMFVNAPTTSMQESPLSGQLQNADEAIIAQKRQQVELQAAQQKLQQQHMLLKQLQQQQAELLEQQQRLQQQQQHVLPQTHQGQQLQQQQGLLQQLQQQFQQQQLLLQQELLRQSQALQSGQAAAAQFAHVPETDPLSQLLKADGLETTGDGKQKKRGIPVPRRASKKLLERQLSGLSKQGKHVRGRGYGSGKGKRLSDVDNRIGDDNNSVHSSDFLPSASKQRAEELSRSVGATERLDMPLAKEIKLDGEMEPPHQVLLNPSTIPEKRVLEQGDADHTTSLVPSMPQEAIERHLASLQSGSHMTPRAISAKCLPVLRRMLDDQRSWVFRDPVDPVVLGLPDYFEVVKNPMHLSLIEQNLENGTYKDMATFERDTKLVFENAIFYNGEESVVGEMANAMLLNFAQAYSGVVDGLGAGTAGLVQRGDVCSLCDSQRRLFEPSVLYCNGACGMQKIRRNAHFYTDRTKSNHWCTNCFLLLKHDEPIILDDGSEIKKCDLQKLKNDATPEEAWVQCDKCDSWVHQICALFNGRKNKSKASYLCPTCHLELVVKGEVKKPDDPMKAAQDLPHSKMSKAIENGLHVALQQAYAQVAIASGIPIDQVKKAEGLSVRVISNIDKKHVVREEMFERYAKNGCPTEFPVRSKCIALFQTIHGVDVILFGMYVFEYNQDCPAPNRRRVYISYLDSVNYFEPKEYRTLSYHTIIIEYLRYVKERGFHTAHIWSCPPSPGDEYIFHCHPAKQAIPRDDRLRNWYSEMLEKAKAMGIVLNIRTLYDEYFKNGGLDATGKPASDPTCLPYFEGDYIPGEIENIIKEVKSDEEVKRKGRDDLPTATVNANDVVGNRRGTRSNPGNMVPLGQDKVMLRLGLAIGNMKQNFLIAELRSRDFASAVEAGGDVSNWREDNDDQLISKRPKIRGKDSSVLDHPLQHSIVKEETVGDTKRVNVSFFEKPPKETDEAPKLDKAASFTNNDIAGTGIGTHSSANVGKQPSLILEVVSTSIPKSSSGGEGIVTSGVDDSKDYNSRSLGAEAVPLDHRDDNSVNAFGESPVFSAIADTESNPGVLMGEDGEENVGAEPTDEIIMIKGRENKRDISLDPKASGEIVMEEHDDDISDAESEPKLFKGVIGDNNRNDESVGQTIENQDELAFVPDQFQTSEFVEHVSLTQSSVKNVDADFKKEGHNGGVGVKRGFEEMGAAIAKHFADLQAASKPIGSTIDEDEPQEFEMFESRQQFLNYCQTNHFQFDELRRAKHTTMMVLFQLHNPNAPKFLENCAACSREITHGIRYHCNECSNFNLCEDCYEPVITGRFAQQHTRFFHDSVHTFSPIDAELSNNEQKNREERARTIKVHLELLAHAGSCLGPPACLLNNCQRMKKLFEHLRECDVTPKKSCKICTRTLTLLSMHARLCTIRATCPLPFCDRIREKNRRRRQQQQLMDDRRRQTQNKLYGANVEGGI